MKNKKQIKSKTPTPGGQRAIIPHLHRLFLKILPGLIPAVIVAAISVYYSQKIATTQICTTYVLSVRQKKTDLIDSMARLKGKMPGMSNLWKHYLKLARRSDLKAEEQSLQMDKDLMTFNSDFHSALYLAGIYFGPKVQEKLKILNSEEGPWWTKNSALYDQIIAEMYSDLPNDPKCK